MNNNLIEAVTVCVNYSDFLKVVISYNLPHLNRWIIVTTSKDEETRELCRKYSLQAVICDDIIREGEDFNKSRAIATGIEHLSHKGWILHLDADIILPVRTRIVLDNADLDTECIYGCDRILVRNYSEWLRLKETNWLTEQHDYHYRVNFPQGYEIGSRWASNIHSYVPIGFFQLWNGEHDLWRGIHSKQYPIARHDASHDDVSHAIQWPRRKRVLLPELIVAHLESEPAKLGANWGGRITRKFEPVSGNTKNNKTEETTKLKPNSNSPSCGNLL